MTLIKREDAIEVVLTYFIPRSHTGERGEHEEDFVRTVFNALPSADAYFTDGNKIAEWIPCSERLPDVDVEVLTTTDWSDVLIAWIGKGGAWETEEHILDNDEILAWIPLPKPYREDSKDYELATEQMEHDAMYEPTYNSEDGSM